MIKVLHADTSKRMVEALNKKGINKVQIINILKMDEQFVTFYEENYEQGESNIKRTNL